MQVSTLALAILLLGSQAHSQGRSVHFPSEDGFQLHGRYHAPGIGGPVALLLHQCNRRGPQTGFEGLAPALAAEGFHVLALDTRGFGQSRDEDYRDFHSQMDLIEARIPQDLEAAYQFLIRQPDIDRKQIVVVGASCGTWQAIPLAKRHAEIRALVFLSGSYLGLATVESDYQAIKHLPVLAIYSEEDGYGTPASMQAAFAQSENTASKMIVYKGAEHGAPLLVQDPRLKGEIVSWLRERLEPVDKDAPL